MEAATYDAPLGKCPEHPEKNAWRTCGRCGRFLCAECTWPSEKGPHCESCHQLVQVAKAGPFRPMMMLPLVSLILSPIVSAFYAVSQGRSWLEEIQLAWGEQWALGVLLNFVLTYVQPLACLYVLPRFLLKKKGVPRLMVWLYGFGLAARLFDTGYAWLLEDTPLAETTAAGGAVGMFFGIAFLAYFALSDEPLRTFVR